MSANRGHSATIEDMLNRGGAAVSSNQPLSSISSPSLISTNFENEAHSSTMTRIAQQPSSDHSASNGLPEDTKTGLVGLLNNSSNLIGNISPSSHLRLSSEMALESGVLKRKLSNLGDDLCSRRKQILDFKAVRLKKIRKDYVEHVCEKLTIEGCGLSDMYRKRPSIPLLLNYFSKHALDPNDMDEDLISLVDHIGVEAPDVKMPSAAVAPQTPPKLINQVSEAVASSSGQVFPQSRSSTPTASRASTPQSQKTPEATMTSQEQIVERAKQEAQVIQRIGELQREGLWAEKRLPKVQEPPRVKAHWDYLLEEMVWLAADFAQERKWKKAAAKKCAKMVQKYFQDKEIMAQKAVRSQELQLKRIAGCMAKEIKQFWSNVEKLVEYKQQSRLEEKRKKALDQHLSFIVDQTEKYSSLVAESMNKAGGESVSHSVVSSRAPSPFNLHHTSDVEFEPGGTSSDDEETIAKAEAEEEKEEGVDRANEIELLQKESELPLNDLLKDYLDNRENIALECDDDDASSVDKDDEFRASDKDSCDDEETIQEQERAEGKIDHKQELDDLKVESEMSIEELKLKYGTMQTNGSPMDTESQHSESEDLDRSDSSSEEDLEDDIVKAEETEDLSVLLAEDTTSSEQTNAQDAEINDVAAIAESIQPKGNTLSSTSVVTKIPFLLKHSLREYQHIGLDWLVTMHDRKLNGILADEMGLGKTIQTISVLAHLACDKGVWGPHLIVVPTSVMLNWEMEFKKWCPAFKILTYYGTQKERKMKRTGWTKPNAFHVCITSYKLVIQDHQSFRRKSWKYLILDEAQNIKNFKSQRWQLLLNFQTQRRLLLTGTPLQNNLMELWSLMHFLMPNVFQSHREFKEWFSNPVTGMIEGNSEYNEQIIKRLHKVLRPFLLRRLKCEVEKQLPKKYEHVVMCRLSNRQRYLYEDFMSRAKTKETLATGNLLSVINVLMQLRKVCNHPNLFEVRPTVSPFQMEGIECFTASCVWSVLDYNPFKHVNLPFLDWGKVDLEFWMSAFMAHRVKKSRTPMTLIEEIDSEPPSPPKCPRGRIRVHVKYSPKPDSHAQVKPAAISEAVSSLTSVVNTNVLSRAGPAGAVVRTSVPQGVTLRVPTQTGQLQSYAVQLVPHQQTIGKVAGILDTGSVQRFTVPTAFAQLVQTNTGKRLLLTSTPHLTSPTSTAVMTSSGQRLLIGPGSLTRLATSPPTNVPSATATSPLALSSRVAAVGSSILGASPIAASTTTTVAASPSRPPLKRKLDEVKSPKVFTISRLEEKRKKWRREKLAHSAMVNEQRCTSGPMYGWDLVRALRLVDLADVAPCNVAHESNPALFWQQTEAISQAILSVEQRLEQLRHLIDRFVVYVPAVKAPRARLHVSHPPPWKLWQDQRREAMLETELSPRAACFHPVMAAMMTQFPDPSLIQYDCGKLQSLDRLLRKLKAGHHRVLIFTQMTRMLDVLEAFLNFHGHIYLRLDGTTKVDQRQVLMERFNGDKRIFCFILSTRSGGVGVNLTGADTVIFYDSDWNPTMDAQAQDRCHRIGQTRDVHIYRLVSEKTVEENILKKANQKRMLGDLAIEGGNFTTAYFKSTTIQDLFNVDVSENDASPRMADVLERDAERRSQFHNDDSQHVEEKAALGVLESALAEAEDETDVAAAKTAKAEAVADLAEFDESIPLDQEGETCEEISKAEQEVNALVQQLSGVERYAMRFIEETEAAWSAEQLAAAEAEIEQQKREWEEERLAALRLEEEVEERDKADAAEELLTYSREDAQNQIWVSQNAMDLMPMWGPPTPPMDDNDIYIDHALCFLYEPTIMTEEQLPPVHIKKERKRPRVEPPSEIGVVRPPVKVVRCQQREELVMIQIPCSLFDRPTPALLKLRHDLRLHKLRGGNRPVLTMPTSPVLGLKPVPSAPEPEPVVEWTIHEDWAILQAVQVIQELTLNLVVICPGHTPNWEMVADMVNMVSCIHRSPRQCKNRYESTIIPREEGKLVVDLNSKKQKKTKGVYKLPQSKCNLPMRTLQLNLQDNNATFSQLMNSKFDSIRGASSKRTPTVKPVLVPEPDPKSVGHAEVLVEFGIDYDKPMTPLEVATRRADRINKEKLAAQKAQQQQIALLRTQIGATSTNKAVIAASPTQTTTTTKPFVQASRSVQELMAAARGNQVVARASPGPSASPQRTATPTPSPTAKGGVQQSQQAYQQRQRQQQFKLAALQQTVTSPSQPRLQQVKQASVTRVAAGGVSVAGKSSGLTPAQILAQAGLQAQQPVQVATLVKTVGGQHLPITLPQVKTTGVKTTTATPQQIRSLQNQLLAQQRTKLTGQKGTQLNPVMVTSKGLPAQLIMQSQKSVPTTMTMQQIQQVIKHVHPQHITHVSAGGQTVVSQGTSGQVISHAVLAKGSTQARLIPQQGMKQTIQVVTASPGVRTSVPSVTSTGAIKVTTPAHQHALLNQVFQQGQPITVRQGPVRLQTSGTSTPLVAVAVTQAPTLLTLSHPPPNNTQNQ